MTSLTIFFSKIACACPSGMWQDWTAMTHHSRFHSARHVANEKPNSPDLKLVDYVIWSFVPQPEFMTPISCDSVFCMCGAAWSCSSRWLIMQLTNVANMLACLCLCNRRTFWIHFVTISLFSLYLNVIFHTMLDATGDILRVHCKTNKYKVTFHFHTVA